TRALVVAHAGDDAPAALGQAQCTGEQRSCFVTLARRQDQYQRKLLRGGVEIIRQHSQPQAFERGSVGSEGLMTDEPRPGACLKRSTSTGTQEKSAARRPRKVAFAERQEECF